MEKRQYTIYKRRLKFYSHLTRMNESRLIKKIFNYAIKIRWLQNGLKKQEKTMWKLGLSPVKMWNEEVFWIKVDKIKVFQEKQSKKSWKSGQRKGWVKFRKGKI